MLGKQAVLKASPASVLQETRQSSFFSAGPSRSRFTNLRLHPRLGRALGMSLDRSYFCQRAPLGPSAACSCAQNPTTFLSLHTCPRPHCFSIAPDALLGMWSILVIPTPLIQCLTDTAFNTQRTSQMSSPLRTSTWSFLVNIPWVLEQNVLKHC